jgi:hypothetical protein
VTYFLTFFIVVVIVCALFAARATELKSAVNPIPASPPTLSADEIKILELYLSEWKVVIETQMHFNDLIIRFRTLTLTTFAALVGAAITIAKVALLTEIQLRVLLLLSAVFWISSALIDFGYYHRLLLGAVAEAEKFDKTAWLAEKGFFGMTECIRIHAPPRTSRILLVVYYALPLVALASILLWWFEVRV